MSTVVDLNGLLRMAAAGDHCFRTAHRRRIREAPGAGHLDELEQEPRRRSPNAPVPRPRRPRAGDALPATSASASPTWRTSTTRRRSSSPAASARLELDWIREFLENGSSRRSTVRSSHALTLLGDDAPRRPAWSSATFVRQEASWRIAALDVFPSASRCGRSSASRAAPSAIPQASAARLRPVDHRLRAGRVGEARPSHCWSRDAGERRPPVARLPGSVLVGLDPWDRQALHAAMERGSPCIAHRQPTARSAVDMAVHDLLARAAGVLPSSAASAAGSVPPAHHRRAQSPPPSAPPPRRRTASAAQREDRRRCRAGPRHPGASRGSRTPTSGPTPTKPTTVAAASVLARRMADLGADCLEQPFPRTTGPLPPPPLRERRAAYRRRRERLRPLRRGAADPPGALDLLGSACRRWVASSPFLAARMATEAGIGLLG